MKDLRRALFAMQQSGGSLIAAGKGHPSASAMAELQ
jgi:hypothetical protein